MMIYWLEASSKIEDSQKQLEAQENSTSKTKGKKAFTLVNPKGLNTKGTGRISAIQK
tara:strand:+ start:230 stop:400 length:171 start_codon:yes stop_codon:yes gene_type:complete